MGKDKVGSTGGIEGGQRNLLPRMRVSMPKENTEDSLPASAEAT